MKKLEKIFWYLFSFFIIYVLVGFKLISYVLETQIIKNIEENLHAKASISRLEFNPFIFKVKIENFNLYDSNKSYASFKNLVLDVELINSIKNKKILVNEVLIDKLKLNIEQNKEKFDLVTLIKPTTTKEQSNTSNENLNIKFLVSSFKIQDSSIEFTKDKNYKINITNLNNTLLNLGNIQDLATNDLSFNFDNSSIKTNTTIKNSDFKDFEIVSDLDISKLDLKKLSDYKKELLDDIQISSIFLDSKVNINFKTKNNSLEIKTKDTIFSNIDVKKSNDIKVKAKNLDIEKLYFNLEKNLLDIGKIDLNKSNISYVLYPSKTKAKEEKTKNKEKDKNSFTVLTNNIKINDSILTFEDKTLKIPFKTKINKLNGYVSAINTKDDVVSDLKVDGVINKYAIANIDAKVNLNHIKILTDVNFKIRNLGIKDFTPYSRKFIAQDLDEGKLDVNLKYNILNANLDAKNNIIINKIKLGQKYEDKDALSLPLGIAIALLEDSRGKIEINLPVTGDLDDPEFSIAPIVWKAFTNLIFKAVTAPFSLLGAIFNFSDDEINKVTFDFNQTNITAIQKEPLDKLIQILKNRPNMAITFSNVYNIDLEKAKIIDEKYKAFLDKKAKKQTLKEYLVLNYSISKSKDEIKKLLEKYKNKDKELVLYLEKFVKENIQITKKEYENLGVKRSENIKRYFVENGVKDIQIIIIDKFIEQSLENKSIIIEFKVDTL